MPDDQAKPKPEGAPETDAPKDAAATPAPDGAAEPQPAVQADPLSDGTVPTVLQKGDAPSHDLPAGGKHTLGSVYRRADIMTTLITFGITIAICGLAFGGYLFLTRTKPQAAAPKVTTLDQTDLSKLGAFFQGDSAGSNGQVLTFNSASLFQGRVALNSDLKVSGAAEVDGPTELGDLTVNKTSTLGVTNVRGQLTVAGPVSLQSPTTLSAGATVTGNVTVSGNGSFGGSVSAGLINTPTLNVNGNLTLSGHILLTGSTPTVNVVGGAGSGATATISGTDTAGTVTVNTGTIPSNNGTTGQQLVQVNFRTAYTSAPVVIITAVGQDAGILDPYVTKSGTNFVIGSSANDNINNPTPVLQSHSSYTFDYWVVQ